MTKTTDMPALTWAQVKAAREAGPHMLEILAGWILAEQTLRSDRVSFRHKLQAANDLAGLHSSAEALVTRVLQTDEVSNA